MGTVYQVKIYNAAVAKGSGNTYDAEVYWTAEESPQKYEGKFLLEIIKSGETVFSSEAEGDARYAGLNGLLLDEQYFYELKITVKDNPQITDQVPLLLHTYENPKGTYDGGLLKLRWDSPASDIGSGKCIVKTRNSGIFSFDIRPYVTGMEIPFDENYASAKEVLNVSLVPYINQISTGPGAVLQDIFCPEYEAVRTAEGGMQVCYKRNSPEETSFSVILPGEIYKSDPAARKKVKPAQPITKGPLTLGVTEPYTLTIQTDSVLSRRDYDEFIRQVYPVVTTSAMYRILEMIARGASQNIEDMLYYHCGLSPEKRCADLRPGFTLRVEQEMYLYQNQLSVGDIAGFIGMHTAEYPVSLAHGESMDYLEFDSFLSLMDEEIEPPRGNNGVKPVGAGIIDLCAVRMRNSFYRIQYPEAMYTSEAVPDEHAGNHIILLAAPGWEDVPLPLNKIRSGSEAGARAAEVTPSLLFRGRSALTLLITVTVNGKEKKIPAGTTIGKMLNQSGIYDLDTGQVRIYRRSPFGEEAQLSFSGMEKIEEKLPLFHGDRIEG